MAVRKQSPKDPEGRMTLAEHLRELRRRVVVSGAAIVAGAVAGWFLYDGVLTLARRPIDLYKVAHPEHRVDISFNNLSAAFSQRMSLSIFVGILLASPIWLYQIWAFIVPGLTRKEKNRSLVFIGLAVPLFAAGVALATVSLPLVVNVLLDFTPSGTINLQQSDDYLSFVTRFVLAFGIAFLLPLFLVALNLIGVLPSGALRRAWRPAVFGIFLFSAIMMPTPDAYSMFLLAGPLTLLYFVAVGVTSFLDRRKAKARPEWVTTPDDAPSTL